MGMRWLLTCATCSVLGGCGMQSAQITVGDTVSVEMHKAESGVTAFDVSLGDRERCTPSPHKFAVMWNDVAARVSAC